MGANGPHDWDEGFEYVYDAPPTRRRLLTFGFGLSPWQLADYQPYYKSIGRFEAESFDPATWKPRVPTAAYLHMRDDDGFWAAQRVMAFSDAMIRAIVKTGEFSEPGAEQYLGDVLIKRRDKIGKAYLTRLVPVVSPALDAAGVLTFGNVAARHALATEPRAWKATWFVFDNATGASTPMGDVSGTTPRLAAPAALPSTLGAYLRIDVSADHPDHPRWATPVRTYFRREASGWKLVGLERQPDEQPIATARNGQ